MFGIPTPPKAGGWFRCLDGGWTCCVEQGHYGHLARKATWLYAFGVSPEPLVWGPSEGARRLDDGYHTAEERARAVKNGLVRSKTGSRQRLSARQCSATPEPFRDLLLNLAARATKAA